jgi:hypothetical protein
MRAFAVVVVVVAYAALILGIRTAFSVRMLGVCSMQVAGLLGGTFGRSPAIASAILVVHLALVAVGGVVIARLVIAVEVVVAIVSPVAVCSFIDNILEVITTSCLADLVFAFLLKRAVANPRVVDALKILREGRERLIAKSVSALDVL